MLTPLTLASLLIYLAVHMAKAVEDAELARRIKRGDHGAFKHFFDRYHGALFGYLRRRGIDEETTADIVQNAFVMIWDKRDQIDENKSLRAFLFRIGYTRALNYFRDNAKFDHHADLDSRSTTDPIGHDYSAMQDALLRAIASLPERRRAVFELCFMEDLSYREAADMLNISIKTVENQMAFALKNIRGAMAHFR
ncbi:MAG: sigma-70 family RNA polymerase sigma factor [Rhodothermales bacterium]|nr:sigma-70 family RNA polymerase sigma factor [Rhodothermales bacterium]